MVQVVVQPGAAKVDRRRVEPQSQPTGAGDRDPHLDACVIGRIRISRRRGRHIERSQSVGGGDWCAERDEEGALGEQHLLGHAGELDRAGDLVRRQVDDGQCRRAGLGRVQQLVRPVVCQRAGTAGQRDGRCLFACDKVDDGDLGQPRAGQVGPFSAGGDRDRGGTRHPGQPTDRTIGRGDHQQLTGCLVDGDHLRLRAGPDEREGGRLCPVAEWDGGKLAGVASGGDDSQRARHAEVGAVTEIVDEHVARRRESTRSIAPRPLIVEGCVSVLTGAGAPDPAVTVVDRHGVQFLRPGRLSARRPRDRCRIAHAGGQIRRPDRQQRRIGHRVTGADRGPECVAGSRVGDIADAVGDLGLVAPHRDAAWLGRRRAWLPEQCHRQHTSRQHANGCERTRPSPRPRRHANLQLV